MVDSRGAMVALGDLIAQGGEGGVYRVPGNPAVVAKLYHQAPSSDRVAKLRAMVAGSSPEILRLTCWPTEIVAERPGGPVKGFLMPSAGGNKEVHKLYSPKSRSVEFQSVDWGFLIQASANVARAFAVVHRDGHVIGDVNHSSVMIAPDATVKLIDCDSFQVQANGQRFPCEVAEPLHMPPELQGKALRGMVRTPNHDNFGLAVLVFEPLFMGRHPFAGMYLGQGDLALEQKIERFMFAYGPKAPSRQMRPPPNTLSLEAASPEIAEMFEVAFAEFSTSGTRPPAADWVRALAKLQQSLKRCAVDAGHAYFAGLATCPWCEIEANTGVTLFSVAFAPTLSGTGFNLGLAWESIQRVQIPSRIPAPNERQLPSIKAEPRFEEGGIKLKAARTQGFAAFLLVTVLSAFLPGAFVFGLLVGAAIWIVLIASAKKKNARLLIEATTSLNVATGRLEALSRQWEATATSQSFYDAYTLLQHKKARCEALPAKRQVGMAELRSSSHKLQLTAYLDRHEIKPGKIPSVGAGRCATLNSYGIETAADVTYEAVTSVPGFGDGIARKIVAWQKAIESGFRFDPRKGIDTKDLRKLESEILSAQHQLEAELMAGKAHLTQISSRIENARASLAEPIEQALKNLAMAKANVRAL